MKENLTVTETIVAILEANGFKQNENLDMFRKETGCMFHWCTIKNYETVLDFQLDWPYSFPDEKKAG